MEGGAQRTVSFDVPMFMGYLNLAVMRDNYDVLENDMLCIDEREYRVLDGKIVAIIN